MTQAAAIKERIAQRYGERLTVSGAPLAGELDAARLRAMPTADALAQLRTLPGIGPFSAELAELSTRWAPYRGWVALLPRVQLQSGRS
ncbi:MAG: hypothetical protein ABSA93_05710 [Streptosporangiaceae bacterium]|jgi:3-methyladenine DNA glycosylase/8-oxoguanine DNA glycosylase